jgi:PAS domain S-box-containing protein
MLTDTLSARLMDRQPLGRQIDELSVLFRLTDALYRANSLDAIYDAALDAIIGALACDRASILVFDETGTMRFVAWRGLSERYRQAVDGHSPWTVGVRDPAPIFIEDIEATDEPAWLKAAIRAEGIRGLGFVPLVSQGEVAGKFMSYYEQPHAFRQEEAALAVAVARQVGFSLERHRAEQAQRRAEEELRESERRFRLMSEHAPVMIWTSDHRNKCVHLNRMLRKFWNVDEADIATFDWQSKVHPEDAPHIARVMQEAVQSRTNVTVKGRYLNAKGTYRVLETDARPRFSPGGEFLGMIGVNADVTEREDAERALRESEERFRLAVEAAPSGMIMTDAGGRIVLVNRLAERLFGYDRHELVGRGVEVIVPERFRANHPEHRSAYGARPAARLMGAGRDLYALRKDGREVPVEIGLSPILTLEGVMTLASIVDISERKAADAQRELLLAELNHRVKNTLAVIQGIAHQTFRGSVAPDKALAAFEGRLIALGAAHNLLTQANWEKADLAELAGDTLLRGGGDRVTLAGPEISLKPKEALAVALALHELYTNAVKYGALSNDDGRVELVWSVETAAARRLTLVWREIDGPPVVPPTHRGFGSRLLERTLAHDLDGCVRVDFAPDGLVCVIEAALPGG